MLLHSTPHKPDKIEEESSESPLKSGFNFDKPLNTHPSFHEAPLPTNIQPNQLPALQRLRSKTDDTPHQTHLLTLAYDKVDKLSKRHRDNLLATPNNDGNSSFVQQTVDTIVRKYRDCSKFIKSRPSLRSRTQVTRPERRKSPTPPAEPVNTGFSSCDEAAFIDENAQKRKKKKINEKNKKRTHLIKSCMTRQFFIYAMVAAGVSIAVGIVLKAELPLPKISFSRKNFVSPPSSSFASKDESFLKNELMDLNTLTLNSFKSEFLRLQSQSTDLFRTELDRLGMRIDSFENSDKLQKKNIDEIKGIIRIYLS